MDELVRAGHGAGHMDVAMKLTWRQIEEFWKVAARRRAASFAGLLVGPDSEGG